MEALVLAICIEHVQFSDRFYARGRAISKDVGYIDSSISRPVYADFVEELAFTLSTSTQSEDLVVEVGSNILFFSRDENYVIKATDLLNQEIWPSSPHISKLKEALYEMPLLLAMRGRESISYFIM